MSRVKSKEKKTERKEKKRELLWIMHFGPTSIMMIGVGEVTNGGVDNDASSFSADLTPTLSRKTTFKALTFSHIFVLFVNISSGNCFGLEIFYSL